jgi:hypothetical protein
LRSKQTKVIQAVIVRSLNLRSPRHGLARWKHWFHSAAVLVSKGFSGIWWLMTTFCPKCLDSDCSLTEMSSLWPFFDRNVVTQIMWWLGLFFSRNVVTRTIPLPTCDHSDYCVTEILSLWRFVSWDIIIPLDIRFPKNVSEWTKKVPLHTGPSSHEFRLVITQLIIL